jgi:predicted Zn-dependent protease
LVYLSENTGEGLTPAFQADGFIRPNRVDLIRAGKNHDALVSPRSAREYGLTANGAESNDESPQSLDMAAGDLAQSDVLSRLDNGLYINNLWYLNYSDRMNCRLTGMTRFATFVVEGGKIVAPCNVMRFDDSMYRALGTELEALTAEREFLPSTMTYRERQTSSQRFPGALVRDFKLTL